MIEFSDDYLAEYIHRVNVVIDYIENHLDKELRLEELASVAAFSKFHFHRIFFSIMGETLFHFIRRLRLEKSCFLLLSHPRMSIMEVAFSCGFSTPSGFTKSFTDYFQVSPSQWKESKMVDSNIGNVESNLGQDLSNSGKELKSKLWYANLQNKTRRSSMSNKENVVVVKDCPEKTVAYVRYIGPYQGNADLFGSLSRQICTWAGPRNLLHFPDTEFLVIYHDNPEITEESKQRISVCLTVPGDTKVDGEIGKMTIPPGKYAFARFRLGKSGYQEAWNWVYGQWLPGSGYAPDDRPCYEQYYNGPEDNSDGMMDLDIVVPVKPL